MIVSWALWPVGVAIFLSSILYFADIQDSLSLYTTMGRTFVVALVVLIPPSSCFRTGPIGRFAATATTGLTSLGPAESSLVVQVLVIMVLGDGLEYWLHRLSHPCPRFGRCTRYTTCRSA